MGIRPVLVDLGKALETDRSLAADYAQEPRHLARRRVRLPDMHGRAV